MPIISDNKKRHYLPLKNESIFDGEKWRNHPVASLCRLLRGKTSNHHGDLYCSNCLKCSYSTDNRFKEHEGLFNKRDYCYPKMPNKYNNLLEYNHGEKSFQALNLIELDIECILKKEHSC